MLAVASNLSAQPSPAAPVTFTKDVAPIVFQHCASCHHPGGAAPFSVLSYSSARLHARQIADVTKRGYMPPWKPAPGSGPFVGENRLTTAEIDLLQRWAESGAPEGASHAAPLPKISTGWQLGTPDLIVNLPAYEVEPPGPTSSGSLSSRCPPTSRDSSAVWSFARAMRTSSTTRTSASTGRRRRDASTMKIPRLATMGC